MSVGEQFVCISERLDGSPNTTTGWSGVTYQHYCRRAVTGRRGEDEPARHAREGGAAARECASSAYDYERLKSTSRIRQL